MSVRWELSLLWAEEIRREKRSPGSEKEREGQRKRCDTREEGGGGEPR